MDNNSNNQISEFGLILKRWKFILFFGLFFACLAFIVSSLITPKFSSSAKILILQDNLDIDAYRAAKASEYAGEIIEKVVGSSNFMDGVAERYPAIAKTSFWEKDYDKRLEAWNKVVNAGNQVNSGIVNIKVLYENKKVNKEIMSAVTDELIQNGESYHGNSNIRLNKISGPIMSNNPAFPNIPLVVFTGFVSGSFLAIGLLLVNGRKIDTWFYSKEESYFNDSASHDYENNYSRDNRIDDNNFERETHREFQNREDSNYKDSNYYSYSSDPGNQRGDYSNGDYRNEDYINNEEESNPEQEAPSLKENPETQKAKLAYERLLESV
jgi:capsular polysaccharide biosynthesis protein